MKKPREKTQYSDELADKIIAENNLNLSVKKVWKKRWTIPTAYLVGDIDKSEKLKDTDSEYQKIIEILKLDQIAVTKFRTLALKGADVKNGKDRMTADEKIGMITEITELRNAIRKALDLSTPTNFRTVLSDARFHGTKIVSIVIYKKVMDKRLYSEDEKKSIIDALRLLYNRLRL